MRTHGNGCGPYNLPVGERGRALRAVLLIAVGAYVLGMWLPRAWYARWIADDYCFAVSSSLNGFWRSQALVYNNAAGRYTVAFLYGLLTLLGPGAARWLSLGAMALWLAAAWRAAHHAFRMTRLEETAATLGFIGAILSTAPDTYQPLIWTGGLLTYGLPIIAATAMAAIVLHPPRGARALLFVLAVMAGGCSEVAAVAQIVFAAGFAIVGRRYRPLLLSIAFGSAAALLIVATAPGNFQRRTLFHPLPVPDAVLTAVTQSVSALRGIIIEGSTTFVPLIVFLALAGSRVSWRVAGTALAGSMVVVTGTLAAALAGTGRLPWGRVQFVPVGYIAIGAVFLALALPIERYAAIATALMLAFAAIGIVTTLGLRAEAVRDAREFAAAADRVATAARVDSRAAIVVRAPHDFQYLEYLHADPNFWTNRCVASYYGLSSIRSGR